MRRLTIAVSALAFVMGSGVVAAVQAQPGTGGGYGQQRWDAPPQEFSEAQRQGFQDGIDGAQKDFSNHRQPDVRNRWEYQHPRLPHEVWDAYRDGFQRGYDRAMSHLTGQGDGPRGPGQPPQGPGYMPQGPGQPQGPGYGPQGPGQPQGEAWEMAPSEFNELQRRGFRDGIEGARKDMGNQRAPNVNNREEYRNPDLRGRERRVYKQAFRRGYQQAISHLHAWPRGSRHY